MNNMDKNKNKNKDEFSEMVKPLIKFLSENHSPHTVIMINNHSAEILEGIRSIHAGCKNESKNI